MRCHAKQENSLQFSKNTLIIVITCALFLATFIFLTDCPFNANHYIFRSKNHTRHRLIHIKSRFMKWYWQIISSQTLSLMQSILHAEIKVKPCYLKGPRAKSFAWIPSMMYYIFIHGTSWAEEDLIVNVNNPTFTRGTDWTSFCIFNHIWIKCTFSQVHFLNII